jgi:pimeloyl-ACP methyl ester carboxylesterase
MTNFVRVNGVELYVEPPVGEGELLVLVHGGWTDHNTWTAVVGPLARSCRVVSYDRRGHTLSRRGPGPSPRRQDEDDLAALVEALDAGPAHLVGTSYGASIALALAGRRPELVRSVVAHEPPLLGEFHVPAVEAGFASVQDQIAAGDAAGATKRFFEDVILGPGGWELVPERVQRAAIGNAQTFLELREDPDWGRLDFDAVARFPGPLIVTHGDASPPWLPRVARSAAGRIGCESRVIVGAGHTPHHTRPEELAAVVEELALQRV